MWIAKREHETELVWQQSMGYLNTWFRFWWSVPAVMDAWGQDVKTRDVASTLACQPSSQPQVLRYPPCWTYLSHFTSDSQDFCQLDIFCMPFLEIPSMHILCLCIEVSKGKILQQGEKWQLNASKSGLWEPARRYPVNVHVCGQMDMIKQL